MPKEIKYWTSVLKRITLIAIFGLITFIAFKIAIFYMPFLIAFTISCILEPLIRVFMKKFKTSRRASSIIIFIIGFGTIFSFFIWGIVTLISESTNLMSSLNIYYDKIYNRNSKYNN